MFGLIKEALLYDLINDYQKLDENNFKGKFKSTVASLIKDKNLKEFYHFYSAINEMMFDDVSEAKEFINEGIEHLKTLNIDKWLNKYKDINKNVFIPEHIKCLDKLIFKKNVSFIDKFNCKNVLVEHLTKQNITTVSIDDLVATLDSKLDSLNEDERYVLDLFYSEDTDKINEYYDKLINECFDNINNISKKENDLEVIKNLNEVSIKLHKLSKESPSIENIEKILHLKQLN